MKRAISGAAIFLIVMTISPLLLLTGHIQTRVLP